MLPLVGIELRALIYLGTAQNFLNFMHFFEKFDKIICWRPWPVGAPSYGESWIRPCI